MVVTPKKALTLAALGVGDRALGIENDQAVAAAGQQGHSDNGRAT
jgi:hypothetical protein